MFATTLLLCAPQAVRACGSCGIGDPTITTMGTGEPFEDRLRLSAELRHRTDEIGRLNRVRLSEQSLEVAASYSPNSRWTFSTVVPLMRRRIEESNGGVTEAYGIGDVAGYARLRIYRDRRFAPSHLLFVLGGVSMPTATALTDRADLPSEAQLGNGAFTPSAGVTYSYMKFPFSQAASFLVRVPRRGRFGFRAPMSTLLSWMPQWHPWTDWALRFGADLRIDGRGAEDGQPEPDTGGMILFASPGLAWRPQEFLSFLLLVRIPVVNALDGYHREGPVVSLAVVNDF